MLSKDFVKFFTSWHKYFFIAYGFFQYSPNLVYRWYKLIHGTQKLHIVMNDFLTILSFGSVRSIYERAWYTARNSMCISGLFFADSFGVGVFSLFPTYCLVEWPKFVRHFRLAGSISQRCARSNDFASFRHWCVGFVQVTARDFFQPCSLYRISQHSHIRARLALLPTMRRLYSHLCLRIALRLRGQLVIWRYRTGCPSTPRQHLDPYQPKCLPPPQ